MSTTTEVHERVHTLLEAELPYVEVDEDGDLNFRSGAAHAWVIVRTPWADDRQVIDVHAITNTEVPVTDELRA